MRYKIDYQNLKQRDLHIRFDGGESLIEFESRSMCAVLECLAPYEATEGQVINVVIVTHGGVVDCICRRAKGLPINLVLEGRLYNPIQNHFLFDHGEFSVCSFP